MKRTAKRFLLALAGLVWSVCSTAGNSLLDQAHAVYKIEDDKVTDFLIELVNADILSKPNMRYIGEVLLSLVPVGRERYFDCERFYKAVGESRSKIVREKMEPYLFKCTNGSYNEQAALDKLSEALKPTITEPYEVDATWAWFSATGNQEALDRFITNYLNNPDTCHRCIEWSYSTNYRQNEDVYLYLKRYSMNLEDVEAKLRLFRLAPRTGENDT